VICRTLDTRNKKLETRNLPLSFQPEPFIPRPRLTSAHAQTLAAWALPRRSQLPPAEERLFSVTPDAQVLCHCHWQAGGDPRLTMIVIHGLEGSSDSQYVIGSANKAWDAGFHVVRMNMRNCGGSERLSRTLYHSGLSADVGAVAAAISEDSRVARTALLGFSMGGNLVLKLAGEWGGSPPSYAAAVAAISPAMDLSASVDKLHSGSNRIYEWNFMRHLRQSIRRKMELFPDLYGGTHLRGVYTIRQFDDVITAPYSGFAGAEDYYQRASSSQFAERITVPTLVIHSHDDPFVHMLPETEQKLRNNPHVTLIATERGGHCAFIASPNGYDGRWAERQAIEFFRQFAALEHSR
jgi:predicted alpha/beta-fold hydrolase